MGEAAVEDMDKAVALDILVAARQTAEAHTSPPGSGVGYATAHRVVVTMADRRAATVAHRMVVTVADKWAAAAMVDLVPA